MKRNFWFQKQNQKNSLDKFEKSAQKRARAYSDPLRRPETLSITEIQTRRSDSFWSSKYFLELYRTFGVSKPLVRFILQHLALPESRNSSVNSHRITLTPNFHYRVHEVCVSFHKNLLRSIFSKSEICCYLFIVHIFETPNPPPPPRILPQLSLAAMSPLNQSAPTRQRDFSKFVSEFQIWNFGVQPNFLLSIEWEFYLCWSPKSSRLSRRNSKNSSPSNSVRVPNSDNEFSVCLICTGIFRQEGSSENWMWNSKSIYSAKIIFCVSHKWSNRQDSWQKLIPRSPETRTAHFL